MLENHLAILLKRLCPEAEEIHVAVVEDKLEGYIRDSAGKEMALPSLKALEKEWHSYRVELVPPTPASPDPLVEIAELKTQIAELQNAVLDLLIGGV